MEKWPDMQARLVAPSLTDMVLGICMRLTKPAGQAMCWLLWAFSPSNLIPTPQGSVSSPNCTCLPSQCFI
jgi:hypothetical protein